MSGTKAGLVHFISQLLTIDRCIYIYILDGWHHHTHEKGVFNIHELKVQHKKHVVGVSLGSIIALDNISNNT